MHFGFHQNLEQFANCLRRVSHAGLTFEFKMSLAAVGQWHTLRDEVGVKDVQISNATQNKVRV